MNGISLKMNMMKRAITALGVGLAIVCTVAGGTASFASGGASGGGKNGGGGGNNAPETTNGVLVTLYSQVSSFNGATPKGTVTLGYAADNTAQSMSFNLSGIKVPDGTVLPVRVIMGTPQTIFTYYSLTTVTYTEVDGTITISKSSATLNLSKAKGDVIPNFPYYDGGGTTEVIICAPNGTSLLDGIVGTFHP